MIITVHGRPSRTRLGWAAAHWNTGAQPITVSRYSSCQSLALFTLVTGLMPGLHCLAITPFYDRYDSAVIPGPGGLIRHGEARCREEIAYYRNVEEVSWSL
jgi:hypothetical protein